MMIERHRVAIMVIERLISMKTLFLLRHAKSSWANPGQADHERPLNERGRKAAVAMGRYIGRLPSKPGLILASTAKRVEETLDLLLAELGADVPVIRDRELYLATPDGLLSRLHMTSMNPSNLMIIGHNPGIHEFALQLSGEVVDGDAYEARRRMKAAYPTAALAIIRFSDARTWRDVAFRKGSLMSFTVPRDLKS